MMKKIIYIFLGLCLSLTGCLHDETTGAHLDISEFSTMVEDSVVYATTAEVLELDADKIVKQSVPDCPVEYTWSVGIIKSWNTTMNFWEVDSLSVISHDRVLKYQFKDLKKHLLRLKVTNEYTACIQYFIVDVTSSYDEGPVVFSQDEQGHGMFSFLNCPKGVDTLLTRKAADFKYVTGVQDPILDEDIVDFAFYSGNQKYPDYGNQHLYLLSKKNKAAYAIDHYSLTTIPDAVYHFSKTPLNLSLHWHSDNKDGNHDLFAFTEDGDVISYCCKFNMEIEPTVFDTVAGWDRTTIGGSRSSGDSKQLADIRWLYNDKTSTVYGMWANDMQKSESWNPRKNMNDYIGPYTFNGEDIITAYYGKSYKDWGSYISNEVYVITRLKSNPKKYMMHIWYGVGWGTNFVYTSEKPNDSYPFDRNDISMDKTTRVLSLPENNAKIYHNGKKVFNIVNIAYPFEASAKSSAQVFDLSTINPNAEITDICLFVRKEKGENANKHYVFVATYDPTSAEEKKGSVYVLAADHLDNVVAKYENVAYKPLRIYYKNRL